MVGYIKLKENNEELTEKDEQNLLKNNKIRQWLENIFYQMVIIIKMLFAIITIKQIYNGYILIFPYNEPKIKNKIKKIFYQYHIQICMNKTKKIMKKLKIDSIVLSNELKKGDCTQYFVKDNTIKNQYSIINGENLLPYLLYDTIEWICKKQGVKTQLEDVYILTNQNTQLVKENIQYMISKFKTVNIITTQVKKMKQLEQAIYEEQGIAITVSNNKKKSLKKAKYIINFDYTTEQLKEFQIYRTAIIIELLKDSILDTPAFQGINIYSLDIDFSNELKQYFRQNQLLNHYNWNSLYESILEQKKGWKNVREKLVENEVKIIRIYGKNGPIHYKELQ